MGHAATAKHTTGRHRTQHSLDSGVLAFRGDRASPVLIQHIRWKVAESPSCREIFSSPPRELNGGEGDGRRRGEPSTIHEEPAFDGILPT